MFFKKYINVLSITAILSSVIASICMLFAAMNLKILPVKYIYALTAFLVLVNLPSILIALSKKMNNSIKIIQVILSIFLSVGFAFGSLKVTDYKGKFERIFVELPEATSLNMKVYVLRDSEYSDIKDLVGKRIGVQTTIDQEHQNIALEDISNQVKKKGIIEIIEYDNIYSLSEALFSKKVDGILLTDIFAEIVAENADFSLFTDQTKTIYNVTQEIVDKHIQDAIPTVTNTPFIVAIAGNDSWNYDNIKNNNGRTDVNIILTVNPLVKKLLMVTITRDAYLPINGETDKMDRLTNASVFGVEAWKKAIEYILDINIDYYFRLSFPSLIDLVNYIGGIDIDNPFQFRSGKGLGNGGKGYYYFDPGRIHLNGNMALSYVRERKSLPKGDFDRNLHQAIVLKGIIEKVTSSTLINNIDSLLDIAKEKIVTDFKIEDIYKLVKMQLEDNAEWQFEIVQIYGNETLEHSYTLGAGQGQEKMYVAHLDGSMIKTAKDKMTALLNEDIEN